MQRDWRDPRDGTEWLLTLTSLATPAVGSTNGGPPRFTISFHRPGHRPCWTGYPLDKPLSQANQQELMDLLDAARREAARSGFPRRARGLERPAHG